jgi:hypothetical protein
VCSCALYLHNNKVVGKLCIVDTFCLTETFTSCGLLGWSRIFVAKVRNNLEEWRDVFMGRWSTTYVAMKLARL